MNSAPLERTIQITEAIEISVHSSEIKALLKDQEISEKLSI